MKMRQEQLELLKSLAQKYVWWKSPAEAIKMPSHVIAQIMNIGDIEDTQKLFKEMGSDVFKQVLQTAQAGQFNAKSWIYWHYRLDLAGFEKVPPLPVRRFS